MSKRHTGRKLAMQALYQADIQNEAIDAVFETFIDPFPYIEETKSWAKELASGSHKNQKEIDTLISKYAIDWEIGRINPIDRNILRMAFFELIYLKTAPSIVVNEALEIAKKYATDDSSKFINGILGNYIKDQEK